MTWVTFTALLVSSMALLASIGACIAGFRLWLQFRSTSAAKQSQRLTEIEQTVEELSAQMRNFRSARNMASHRARQASRESSEPSQPDSDERARLNELAAQRARSNSR